MSTLTNSVEKSGKLTYATTSREGTHLHLAAKHIVGYNELPGDCIMVITSGSSHTLSFDNSTDRDAAKVVLDDAMAG